MSLSSFPHIWPLSWIISVSCAQSTQHPAAASCNDLECCQHAGHYHRCWKHTQTKWLHPSGHQTDVQTGVMLGCDGCVMSDWGIPL